MPKLDEATELRNKLLKLKDLAQSMDSPAARKEFEHMGDVMWFIRNALINNADHPDINKAMELARDISKVIPR